MKMSEEMMLTIYRQFWRAIGIRNYGSSDEHHDDERLTADQQNWLIQYSRRWDERQDAATAAVYELERLMERASAWYVANGFDAMDGGEIECARNPERWKEAVGMFEDRRDRVGLPVDIATRAIELVRELGADLF